MIVELPWPPPTLSPNRRQHWSRSAKAKAEYRARCRTAVLLSHRGIGAPAGDLLLDVVFYPPDRRSYDRDNLLARIKAGIDGMCDALGFDDSRFTRTTVSVGEPVKGGLVSLGIGKP